MDAALGLLLLLVPVVLGAKSLGVRILAEDGMGSADELEDFGEYSTQPSCSCIQRNFASHLRHSVNLP